MYIWRATGQWDITLKYFLLMVKPFPSKDECLVYFFLSSAGFRNIGCTFCQHMNGEMLRHSKFWYATSVHKALLQAQMEWR